MPNYEYECVACGHFEAFQRITDDALERCPTCGKSVQRLVSLSSFTLKGGGWYKDLYASAGSNVGKSADSSTTPASPTASSPTPSAPAAPSGSSSSSGQAA